LMAYADLADPERKLSEAELAGLVELADEFQGARYAKQVLDAVPAARKIAAEAPRRGALWAALADDPTCEAIAGAWTHDLQRVPPMLAALSRTARQTLIARRLAVSHEVMFEGSEDVTRDAWSIVEANNLVDPTYTGAIAGPSPGSHTTDAMANAVTWLSNHDFSPPPDREALWKAALKREDELEYKGGEHLKAAEALADDAPEVAFEQMVSAAAYQARESGRVAPAALRAAADLARARSWADLGQALDWALA
ncbi:MAG: hypothetical protein JWQ29_1084, partial [Phenylobacterium sp.]|nr:hypothetical protein [Phenylobacterium sp.]